MRRTCTLITLVVLGVHLWGQSSQPSPDAHRDKQQNYDGTWWAAADPTERAGFMNGAGDCLTWTARGKGFNGTPEQYADKISSYYASHPQASAMSVVDAWAKVVPRARTTATLEAKGETWTDPHWYLNGNWWSQGAILERQGYLEGYLWCNANRVVPKTENYSQPISFYQRKIDAYVNAHSNSGKQSVASILSRFRDEEGVTANK